MVCSHECACGSVDRENVADLQAYVHLARYVAVRYPAFANEAVALLCDIFRLREAVVESLEVVGRVSVKDASGIDIRRNCIEVLLVTDPCKMTRNRVGRSNLTPRISQELLLLGGETTLPCLDAVRRFVEDKQIDQSLLRHFTSQVIVAALVVVVFLPLNRLCPQVAKLISPAGGCSPAFVRGFLELLQCPHTVAALRGDHARQDKSAVFSWLDGVDTTRFGAVSID